MIVGKLMGGLGNQMFQYAAGRALAEKYHTDLYLDMAYFSDAQGMVPRPFELNRFFCDVRSASGKQIRRITARSKMQRGFDKLFGRQFVYLRDNDEMPVVRTGKIPSVYMDGYWQSENYFKDIDKKIRAEFTFVDKFNNETRRLAGQIDPNNSAVSVHIRRGDYLASEAMKNFLGVCSVEYYKKAFELIEAKVGSPFYYVFSDDPDWVTEHIIGERKDMAPVFHNRSEDSWQDMYLMSCCKHHIIANSSFSWWGAWLDPNPGKVVIAPQQWFLAKELYDQIKNIIPEKWIRI